MSRPKMLNEIQEILKQNYTNEGMVQWWERPHVKLDGRTPYEVWHDHDYQKVLELALSLEAGNSL